MLSIRFSSICSIQVSLNPDLLPLLQHDAASPHTRDAIVKVRSGAWFPSNMMPKFKDNTLNLGFYPDMHLKLT